MTPFIGIWQKTMAAILAGGVLAGGSGLILAGGTRSTVARLETDVEKHDTQITEIGREVSALGSTVRGLEKQVEAQRREQNIKLDAILGTLNRALDQ